MQTPLSQLSRFRQNGAPPPRIPTVLPTVLPIILLVALMLLVGCAGRQPAQTRPPTVASTPEAGGAVQPDAGASATTDASGKMDKALREAAAIGVAQAAGDESPIYHAQIAPVDQVQIVAQVAGQIVEVAVGVGDAVNAGGIVARIDSVRLEAERAQALAALEAAQAQLELLAAQAGEAEIEAARAAVAAADAAYKRAIQGPTPEMQAAVEARLRQAEAALSSAQAAYDRVSWNPLIASLPEAQQLEQARLEMETAQAAHDRLAAGADTETVAAAYAQLAAARALLQRLEDGPDPAQLRAAEAQVRQAETALYLAQLQLDKATVRAPITGIISQITATTGAVVEPGAPVALVLSPDVQIVIGVQETDIPSLSPGQDAEIQVAAYPGEVFAGEVTAITPELDPTTQTVSVIIQPTGDATRLLPGMDARVQLLNEE